MARNIQREFVKYYKERLASLGFIKVKGRQPYFVRVINDEILHILTLDTGMSAKDGYKVAHLECGVATVYRQEINLLDTIVIGWWIIQDIIEKRISQIR